MFNISNREIQIKATVRYHLTSVRMTIIKKKKLQIKNAGEKQGKQGNSTLLVGM